MQIALDATPLTAPTGGVARYTLALARALAENNPDDRCWLVSDQPFAEPRDLPPNLRAMTFSHRRWWSIGLARELARLGADVFHGTDFSVPYIPLRPSVMTLHDLSPWLDPAWQPSAGRIRRRTPILLRAGAARMVITPTEAIRAAAVERFALDPARVIAIPLAASGHFRPVRPPVVPTPYFLFVGTLEPRKNIGRLIEAWREVRKRHPVDLVLAGRVREDFSPPAREPGLRLLGAVDDDQLPTLYSGAAAVLDPSLYEGFGLPVLEAMQCGALVVASRDPATLEVTGGSAAIHVDANDTGEMIAALHYALAGVARPGGRARAPGPAPQFSGARDSSCAASVTEIRRRAIERARCFTWARTAQLTREVYARISR